MQSEKQATAQHRLQTGAQPIATVILAAGEGRRMRSALPKVLHRLAGAPLLHHAMRAALALSPERVVVVVPPGADAVAAAARVLHPETRVAEQPAPLGTAHAVRAAEDALAGFRGDLLVLYADTPFITPATLERMRAARAAGADLVVLGFEAAEPGAYGRLVTGDGDALLRIVEARDAGPAERAVTLCNSGVMAADAETLLRLLARVGNDNAAGEYYLTDVVALARAEGLEARVVRCEEAETLGINDRVQLAGAEALFQARARREAMLSGVTMVAPETVFLAWDTRLARDVWIGPNVVFGPGVHVEEGAEILGFCHVEGCRIAAGARVGPFARLRPGAEIGPQARIGNFVEVKNAVVGAGAKANHLAYIGDAEIGAGANLGAGTVTCNYDGFAKHRTEIGEEAFIGVNTALVAPVRIGARAYVGTGTVVTRDVPEDALALGRAEQVTRPGYAARLRARLRSRAGRKNRAG